MSEQSQKLYKHLSQAMAIGTGLISLLSSVWGLYLSWKSVARALAGDFTILNQEYNVAYFYASFYPMLSVTVACCLLLGWCGLDQIRAKLSYFNTFIGLLIFELVYLFFIAGVLWRFPSTAMNVASATGVANQGLMPQYYFLFPVWAPFVLWWAKKQLRRSASGSPISRQIK